MNSVIHPEHSRSSVCGGLSAYFQNTEHNVRRIWRFQLIWPPYISKETSQWFSNKRPWLFIIYSIFKISIFGGQVGKLYPSLCRYFHQFADLSGGNTITVRKIVRTSIGSPHSCSSAPPDCAMYMLRTCRAFWPNQLVIFRAILVGDGPSPRDLMTLGDSDERRFTAAKREGEKKNKINTRPQLRT